MASIPELPGVLTQGETIDEARAMIHSALRDWLQFYVRTSTPARCSWVRGRAPNRWILSSEREAP